MRLLVIGAGGHAKVVIDTAVAAGWEIAGVVGSPEGRREILGYPVLSEASGIGAEAYFVAVGDNVRRARVFDEYRSLGLPAAVLVHPSAVIGRGVEIGAGTLVAPGAIINVDARIGADTIINTGCVIEHDCVVGDHVLVGPTASLCGACTVGEGVLLGAGVSAVPAVSIGEWSIVGAGAAVVSDLPAGMICVGVPARPVRPVEARP